MANTELRYSIIIDAKTGQAKLVENNLKGIEKQTDKIGTAATQAGSKFGGMGSIIKGLGIAAVLGTFATQAFKGSDALQQVGSEMLSMVSTITKELEPAFVIIARAVKGLSEILTGLVKIIVNQVTGSFKILTLVLKGEFSEAAKQAGKTLKDSMQIGADAAVKALEGFAGRSQIIMKQTVDNMLSELLRDLKDTKLTGAEKLKIIDENEKKLIGLLKQTGDFRQADDDTRKQLVEKILKKLAGEREAAELEEQAQTLAHLQALRDLRAIEAEQVLADTQATEEQKLEALAIAFEAENEVIAQDAENKKSSDEAVKAATLKAQLGFQASILSVKSKGIQDDKKLAAEKKKAEDAEFKATQKFAQDTISGAANAAAQEFAINRNAGNAARAAGADAIRTAANTAAKVIAVKGAEATARAFAAAGGFPTGIPAAVATALLYTGLAATVSAVGGVVAGAVAPPSGGGAAAGPPAAEGDFGGPAPVEDVGGGGGETPEALGGPPTAQSGGRPNVQVTISGLDILDGDRIVQRLTEVLERNAAT